MYVYIYMYIHICMYLYLHMYIYVCIHKYVYMFICIYMHTVRHEEDSREYSPGRFRRVVEPSRVKPVRGARFTTEGFLIGLPREQKLLEGHLPRVIYHQLC